MSSEKAFSRAIKVFSDAGVLVSGDTLLAALDAAAAVDGAELEKERDAWKEQARILRDRCQKTEELLGKENAERDSIRKALDDRHAADKKAWSAIMRATGKERGIPPNKEVVAFYVAEVERLEKERDDLGENLKITQMAESVALEDRDFCKTERDSLRTKLDRAKEALMKLETYLEEFDVEGGPVWINSCWHIVRAVLAELSADAPAQQTQRDVITRDRDIILQALAEYDAWMLDDDYDATAALHAIMKWMRDRALVEPAQQTQISDEVREAMVEAEKALEEIASQQLEHEMTVEDAKHAQYDEGYEAIVKIARTALAKLRSVMK